MVNWDSLDAIPDWADSPDHCVCACCARSMPRFRLRVDWDATGYVCRRCWDSAPRCSACHKHPVVKMSGGLCRLCYIGEDIVESAADRAQYRREPLWPKVERKFDTIGTNRAAAAAMERMGIETAWGSATAHDGSLGVNRFSARRVTE